MPGGIGWLIAETLKRNKQNPGAMDTANSEFASAMKAIDEMIAKIMAYQPPPPAVITPGSTGGNPKMPKSANDSLVSVGNFLGSGRGAVETIAKEQLTVAKQANVKHDRLYELLKARLAMRSIIVP